MRLIKKRNTGPLIVFLTSIILFPYSSASHAQSYGVAFYSHEVIQDKRSSLDLFPDKPVCFNDDFDVSFDMSFLPAHKDYFGYVFRLIKNDNLNIDLIYDHSHPHFSIVVGEQLPVIRFNIDSTHLFEDWHTVTLKLDFKNDRIIFFVGSARYTQDHIGLKKGDCFKIYFGASQYKQFKVTDVPPMKIRNVKLFNKGSLRFSWPLNEIDGTISHDTISKTACSILNPIWLKSSHYNWKLAANLVVKGYAAVAFNKENETLYLAGKDSLYSFQTSNDSFSRTIYKSGRQSLLPGNQGVYSGLNNKLYSIYIDQRLVTGFDLARQKWNKSYQPGPVTDFWQFNKFFSAKDTSVYIIGGYGHYKYRNEIYRYHIPTDSFQNIDVSGDRLIPRYLAGLGQTAAGDTAYILGGYGSLTGQQIVNPQTLYDLVVFDAKNRRFKKLFELQKGREEFVFANSLVIDEKSKNYYGLTFPNYKYNTELQLIRGSLLNPGFTNVGGKIPYAFHDINSYSDLFYSSKTNRFIAVTLLTDSSEQTFVKIYSLNAPAEAANSEQLTPLVVSTSKKTGVFYWLLLIPPVIAVMWFVSKKYPPRPITSSTRVTAAKSETGKATVYRQTSDTTANPVTAPALEQSTLVESLSPNASHEDLSRAANYFMGDETARNTSIPGSIFLFGEMQVIDKTGADITKSFTPLIKELFLIILLYTFRKGRGISSEKLNEILWFDKSVQSARNNRSVNIAKLKNILEKLGDVTLSKDTGYWKIEFKNEEVKVDFQQYLSIVGNRHNITKHQIAQLATITQAGSFLANIEHEWLDKFKSEVSNEIIDTYLHYAAALSINDDSELLLKIAHYIFNYDPVNEEAMIMKCKAFAHLGKHTLAKNAFDNFAKEYRMIYGEAFSLSFHAVIGE